MFSLIIKIYKKQIDKLIAQSIREYEENKSKEDNKLKIHYYKISFPVGMKVIFRSNEPDPLLIGEIVGHELVGQSQKSILCIVRCQETGKEFMPMSRPVRWSQAKEDSLRKLQWWEQWNVMTKGNAYMFTKEAALGKESKKN